MGMYYSAKIFVGLHRDDLPEELVEAVHDSENDMDTCPPFYDGGAEELIGYTAFESGDYEATEFEFDASRIEELKAKFKEETGLDAKVWISPCGW